MEYLEFPPISRTHYEVLLRLCMVGLKPHSPTSSVVTDLKVLHSFVAEPDILSVQQVVPLTVVPSVDGTMVRISYANPHLVGPLRGPSSGVEVLRTSPPSLSRDLKVPPSGALEKLHQSSESFSFRIALLFSRRGRSPRKELALASELGWL